MKPLIGVLPLLEQSAQNFWINPKYMYGIEAAGGVPVVLHLTNALDSWENLCAKMDGFVFTGGQDVGPSLYHQEKIPQCHYQAELRDLQELWMLQALLAMDKPVLGICRGCQILNVACGGTLYQDIPTQHPSDVIHGQDGILPRDESIHTVSIVPDSKLYHLLNQQKETGVNSLHHQAVCDVGDGLRAVAFAPDGLVEAVESPAHRFVLGVQWHPELLWEKRPEMLEIFRGLVSSCT